MMLATEVVITSTQAAAGSVPEQPLLRHSQFNNAIFIRGRLLSAR